MIDVDTVYGAVGGTSAVRHNSRLQDQLSSPLNVTFGKATTAVSTNSNSSYPSQLEEPQSPRQSTGSISLLKSLTNSLTSKRQSKSSSNSQKMAPEAKPSAEGRSTFRSLLPIRRSTTPQVSTKPEKAPQQPLSPPPPRSASPPHQLLQQLQQHHAQAPFFVPEFSNDGSSLPQEHLQSKLNSPSVVSSSSSALLQEAMIAPANQPRPLPTPPKARRVRFALYHDVLEIDNIDDLTMMGYYDDYDSELGWNYRNESLDDTVHGEDGFEYDYDCEDYADEDEDMEPSPTVQLRMPVNYGDLVYHQPLHPSLQQPFYQVEDNLHSRTPSEESRYAESEASTMDDESIIAEDDIIYRFGMDGLYTMSSASMVSLQNYQGIMQRFQHFDNRIANKANCTSDDTLACPTPAAAAAQDQANPALNKEPSRLKSPPPPSRLRYSPPLPSPSPSPAPQLEEQQMQSDAAAAVESLFSRPYSPVPMEVDAVATEAPRAAVNSSPEPQSSQVATATTAPRLNRSKIMEQVAERKRNRAGVFARRASLCGPSAMTEDKELHRGLLAVNKPAGVTSTTIVDLVQFVARRNQAHPLVQRLLELDGSKRAKRGLIKVGHGGTLDPLARGIVVIGIGAGCKKLHSMNGSSKVKKKEEWGPMKKLWQNRLAHVAQVYIAECRLGFSSTTLDSTGSLVAQGKTDHITKDSVIQALSIFKGEISQTPPLYSALNMDGKRLYDYAREGLALPREIPSRKVQIYELELLSFPDDHSTIDPSLELYNFRVGQKDVTPDQGLLTPPSFSFLDGFRAKRMTDILESNPDHVPIPSTPKGLVFHLRVHCSSGTYIRTLIADIAAHLGTVGHMTDLLRVEQSVFKLGGEATLEIDECVDVEALSHAIQAGNRLLKESSPPNLLNDGCSIE
ncbi:hypothetical protein BGX34_008819 [Mortierella sp. NVP85]|nr:hypothetical protein BGX34_008819 [Mortierella sp. NVP85]